MKEPPLGQGPLPAHRLPGQQLLRGAQAEAEAPKSLDEVDPKLLETYEKLGIPLHEQKMLAGVAVDAVFDSVSVATTFKGKLAEAGVIFCSISEAVRSTRSWSGSTSAASCPYTDNFFATLNSRGVHRRLVRLRAQGRALPDGAVDVLPHQRAEHRAVRAHADHRRRGELRELPRGLHGAAARREPAARGGGRAGRPRRRADQVLAPSRTGTRATRTASAASTTS